MLGRSPHRKALQRETGTTLTQGQVASRREIQFCVSPVSPPKLLEAKKHSTLFIGTQEIL